MNHIKIFFWAFLIGLTGLWWLTDTPTLASLTTVASWRGMLMQVTGVLAMGVMSVAMILSSRPVLFEPYLGGLDKMYRLHKWLGIAALVLAVSHWLIANGPKWLSGLGLMERGAHGPRGGVSGDAVRQFFMGQKGIAESLGEWAFYAAAVLMVLALVKRFPYKYFLKTHRLLAVAYLALVWHSFILLKFDDWSGLIGPVMLVLMMLGSAAAVMVLLGRVAIKRQLVGEVAGIRRHEALQVMEIDITFQGHWPGHEAGQFAFVTLHADEGAHPYTISSTWANDGRMTFIIKALGDYTSTLPERVKLGDVVRVEGPYGRFNFDGGQQRQIWVGAGIGITPFIARMQTLANVPDGRQIDLFHSTRVLDPQAIRLMERDAAAAKVQLHVLSDARDGMLDAARIVQLVPDWREADIWFCGPTGFGQALKHDFMAMGLASERFHQELFEMR
ncbi:MAG: ferric reductase [Rhodoferax ferrireducens]|uniref:Ferric reductase n=1 Tax=Rhodoferax ferrireducens TaxID=192843 RepID=A0A1W9KWK2_9BURK|nr:MAG: ferric reductase [Rhodoferax ferrireducens]